MTPVGEIKVVIAEDHPRVREGIKQLLKKMSDLVLVGEAMEIIEKEKPDLLILDLHMPVMDGIQVIDLLALRPSGFLAFGLLVLIATLILRVFGSMIAFVYERDWRYAGITFVVFLIVVTSILLRQR